MGHRWPYTNFHELNQDWIVKTVKNIEDITKRIVEYLSTTYITVGYDADTESLVFFIPDSASFIEAMKTISINIPIYPPEGSEDSWQMFQS